MLNVYGTLTNAGTILNRCFIDAYGGTLNNSGTITGVDEDADGIYDSNTAIENGATLTNSGTINDSIAVGDYFRAGEGNNSICTYPSTFDVSSANFDKIAVAMGEEQIRSCLNLAGYEIVTACGTDAAQINTIDLSGITVPAGKTLLLKNSVFDGTNTYQNSFTVNSGTLTVEEGAYLISRNSTLTVADGARVNAYSYARFATLVVNGYVYTENDGMQVTTALTVNDGGTLEVGSASSLAYQGESAAVINGTLIKTVRQINGIGEEFIWKQSEFSGNGITPNATLTTLVVTQNTTLVGEYTVDIIIPYAGTLQIGSGSLKYKQILTEASGETLTGTVVGNKTETPDANGYYTLTPHIANISSEYELNAAMSNANISGAILTADISLMQDVLIPAGKTLTVPAGTALTNNGMLNVYGTLTNAGTVFNNRFIDVFGTGTLTNSGTITGANQNARGVYGTNIGIEGGAKLNNTGTINDSISVADYYRASGSACCTVTGSFDVSSDNYDKIAVAFGAEQLSDCLDDRKDYEIIFACGPTPGSNTVELGGITVPSGKTLLLKESVFDGSDTYLNSYQIGAGTTLTLTKGSVLVTRGRSSITIGGTVDDQGAYIMLGEFSVSGGGFVGNKADLLAAIANGGSYQLTRFSDAQEIGGDSLVLFDAAIEAQKQTELSNIGGDVFYIPGLTVAAGKTLTLDGVTAVLAADSTINGTVILKNGSVLIVRTPDEAQASETTELTIAADGELVIGDGCTVTANSERWVILNNGTIENNGFCKQEQGHFSGNAPVVPAGYSLKDLRFEMHSDGVPYITWTATDMTDATFKVFADAANQYCCRFGETKACEMPAFTTMPGSSLTGFRVEAYDAQGTMLASVENPAMKLVSADAAAGQTNVTVSVAQDSTNNGLYQVSVSGLSDYQIIGIFFCADNTGNDSVGDFIPTDGKDRVIACFPDDGSRCMSGCYTIYSGSNYAMSDNNNTVTFNCACLADRTLCPEAVSRGWLAEQICSKFAIDTSRYDPQQIAFTDCSGCTDAQKRAIMALTDAGYMGGTSPTTYAPSDGVNRWSIAMILWRMLGEPAAATGTVAYTDVRSDHWSYQAVQYLHSVGVLPAGTEFRPDDPVSRTEALQWIASAKQALDATLSSFSISNLHFTQAGDIVLLEWDASASDTAILPDIQYRVSGRPVGTSNYLNHCGSRGYTNTILTFPAGSYDAFRVEAYYGGTMIASAEANLNLNVTAQADVDVASAVFTPTTVQSEYQVNISNLNGYSAFQLYYGKSGALNDGFYGAIGSTGTTQKTVRSSLLDETDAQYCIYGMKDYSLSTDCHTASYTITKVAAEQPVHDAQQPSCNHQWEKSISAATWLLPEESTCSACGEMRIDAPCLRDVAQNAYTVTPFPGSSFTLKNGTDAYFLYNAYSDTNGAMVYTERIICRQSDNKPLEYDCWYGDDLSNQQLFYSAELYEWTNDSVLYRQVAEFSHNTEYRISKKTYYQMNGDGTYILEYWYDNYAYDAAGNMLEYKQYEANGHHAWTNTYSYYPNGVRESSKLLDPDNNNRCWDAWYYTAEGKEWKHEYVTDAGTQTDYFNGYSATNPYVYVTLQSEYTALSTAEKSVAYALGGNGGNSISAQSSGAIHMKADNDYYYFCVQSSGSKPAQIVVFPCGYNGAADNGAASWHGDVEIWSNTVGSFTTYCKVPKTHISSCNDMCDPANMWVIRIQDETENGLNLIVDSTAL